MTGVVNDLTNIFTVKTIQIRKHSEAENWLSDVPQIGCINQKCSVIDRIFLNSDEIILRPSVTLTHYTEGDLL